MPAENFYQLFQAWINTAVIEMYTLFHLSPLVTSSGTEDSNFQTQPIFIFGSHTKPVEYCYFSVPFEAPLTIKHIPNNQHLLICFLI